MIAGCGDSYCRVIRASKPNKIRLMSKAKNQPSQKSDVGITTRAASDLTNQNAFALKEHLQVQMKIEELAHQLWRMGGCVSNSTLNDWLHAENKVLAEFTKARMRCDRVQFAPAQAEIKISKKPVVLPAISCQIPTLLKSKPTAVFNTIYETSQSTLANSHS